MTILDQKKVISLVPGIDYASVRPGWVFLSGCDRTYCWSSWGEKWMYAPKRIVLFRDEHELSEPPRELDKLRAVLRLLGHDAT